MTCVEEPCGALLSASNLSKRFALPRSLLSQFLGAPPQVLHALDQVNLTIHKGEALGIVGESGCGKSTLARCLVGLQQPSDGEILFRGTSVSALRGEAKQTFHSEVQMIFQDPISSLNLRMTVGRAIREVLKVHNRARGHEHARVEELLRLVGLPQDSFVRRPYQFSGGQRQRVGIARALAVEPRILIADEAVSALDVSVQGQIINLFLELQSALGLSLIFISHDLRLVRHISHRVMVMYLGRVVETGPAWEVFERPRHPYTGALRSALPTLKPRPDKHSAAIRGELPSPLNPPSGCAFHTRCPVAQAICKTDIPALTERNGGWPVACHFPDTVRPSFIPRQPTAIKPPPT
jgi:oligopeptide/dipeptide ABC transporter ATP-binding protein